MLARGLELLTTVALVKLENLRRLRELRPDVEVVGTTNAEDNVPMRAVNARLGFVPVLTLTSTVVALSRTFTFSR